MSKPQSVTPRSLPKVVEGRPGPVPGMRPAMGGAGHVVPASQKGGSSMSVIMPIYTVGIVIFFTYTLMKLLFKKQPDGVGGSLYPPIDPDPRFRKEVFESDRCKVTPRLSRDTSGRIVVNAMSALLDEVDEEYEARRIANEIANQAQSANRNLANGNISHGGAVKSQDDQEQTSVKVLGMEMTASCEGGQKWSRPNDPVVPTLPPPPPQEPPQEIYLEGALPAQSQLLVADSATEATVKSGAFEDPAVVLAGKMTLSVISLDSVQDDDPAQRNNENGGLDELVQINGDKDDLDDEVVDDEAVEESKYTTASNATAAENDISDDENTDNEEVEDEGIEEIEVEDGEIEVEDEEIEEIEVEDGKIEELDFEDREIEVEDGEIEEFEVDDDEMEEIDVDIDADEVDGVNEMDIESNRFSKSPGEREE